MLISGNGGTEIALLGSRLKSRLEGVWLRRPMGGSKSSIIVVASFARPPDADPELVGRGYAIISMLRHRRAQLRVGFFCR